MLKLFRKKGNELVSSRDSILTYSLSMRVIQALWGVDEVKAGDLHPLRGRGTGEERPSLW